ncbi:MAG: flagellar protein FlaG [Burkholderiales bacterium]|nr:flagellar protein FlaG [Burkholderiales bacterium]
MDVDQIASGAPVRATPQPLAAPAEARAQRLNQSHQTQDGKNDGAASGTNGTTSAVDTAALKKSVSTLNEFIQPHFGSIEFSVDDTSGKTLLKIVDKETDAVLMQIPSKEALALAQSLGQKSGNLIKATA